MMASLRRATLLTLATPFSIAWALLAYALVSWPVPWEKEYVYSFERNTTRLPHEEDITESDYSRVTVHFESQGVRLEGWFYEPSPQNPVTPPPCIVMSHGVGAQKDMSLHGYAEQLAQAGIAVLVFDYRGFGGSDGEIRHWVSWKRHLQDVQAALDWVHAGGLGKGRVDTSRLGLWGVSYSGGLVLMTAAAEHNQDKVKAVVAVVPFLAGDGSIIKAVRQRGLVKTARLLLAAFLDKGREWLGLSPIYLRLIGSFKELAILNVSDEELAASRGNTTSPPIRMGGWKSLASARMLIDHLTYKPIKHVHKVQCPVILVSASKDDLTPASHIHAAKQILGDRAVLLERSFNHIEMHRKLVNPTELAPIIDFLRGKLGVKPAVHVDTHPHETDLEQQPFEAA